ncbi:prophage PSSB64-02 [Pseudomonas amygdali pv. lachrymans]|nr:prophage PSSB64-02 [Pseudomonas amygdali pv. lachrymans]
MLDAIGEYDSLDPSGVEAMDQITAHFMSGAITLEEFNHYCARQRKAVLCAPRRAA